jgi:glycosyltransferase involved in cell wall biosynthesis
MSLRILWVINKYLDISSDRITWLETARKLENLGHSVILLTGYKKEKPDFGLKGGIRYVPSISIKILGLLTSNVSLFVYTGYYLITEMPDFLIVHPINCLTVLPFTIIRKLKLIKTRFVLDVRTIPVECFGFSGKMKEILFDLSVLCSRYLFDGITVITPFMKKVLSEKYDLGKNNLNIWTSGASPELFDPSQVDPKDIEILRKKMNLKNRFAVMYHGVLTPTRGLKESIKAIKLLVNKKYNIVLLLIGDGIAKAELETLANSLDLQGHVIIKGTVPYQEVPLYIALADVGILPFPNILWWRVSSPIKLMEYLAMEKPVIVTDIEAHRNVLISNNSGFFIASHDPETIAQGILRAYQSRKHLKTMGQRGRKIVQEEYTWEKQALKLDNFLRSFF